MWLLPICGAFFLLYPLTTLALLTALTALRRGRVIVGFDRWSGLFFGTLLGKKAMVLCINTSINFQLPSPTLQSYKNSQFKDSPKINKRWLIIRCKPSTWWRSRNCEIMAIEITENDYNSWTKVVDFMRSYINFTWIIHFLKSHTNKSSSL